MEEITEASGGGLLWFQTALSRRRLCAAVSLEGRAAGHQGPGSAPVLGKRIASIRNHFSPLGEMAFAMFKDIKVEHPQAVQLSSDIPVS